MAASLTVGVYASTIPQPQNDRTIVPIHPSITGSHGQLLFQQNNCSLSRGHLDIKQFEEGEKKSTEEARIQIACLILQGIVRSEACFLISKHDFDSLVLWPNEIVELNPSVPVFSFLPPSFLNAERCCPAWSPSGNGASTWIGKKEWPPRLQNWKSFNSGNFLSNRPGKYLKVRERKAHMKLLQYVTLPLHLEILFMQSSL